MTATQTAEGVYTFTITLGAQCETMPIEYGTLTCNPHRGLRAGGGLSGLRHVRSR